MPSFGPWTYTVDRDATVAAYARVRAGDVDTCECADCRNFRVARFRVFPANFLMLLDSLGVDFRKDAEIYRCGSQQDGGCNYVGWYHFVGRLEAGEGPDVELAPRFSAHMSSAGSPRALDLAHSELVEIHFVSTAVPWLLDEPDVG